MSHRFPLSVLSLCLAGLTLAGCNDSNDSSSVEPEQPVEPTAPYAVDLYLKGEFSSWSAQEGYKFKYRDGSYHLDNVLFKQSLSAFKVADPDWALATTFTADLENETRIIPDTPATLTTGEGGANMVLAVEKEGRYDFELDAKDPAHPVLSFALDAPPIDYDLYLRGGFNGWGTSYPLTYQGDGIYAITTQFTPGRQEFKIANSGWDHAFTINLDTVTTADLDTAYPLDTGDNGANSALQITESGFYRVTLDASADPGHPVLKIVKTTGGDDVTIDPHAGHEASQTLSYPVTGVREEQAVFSVAKLADPLRSYAQSSTQDLRDPGNNYVTVTEQEGQPRVRSGSIAFDALFALAVQETKDDSVSQISDDNYNGGAPTACDCFQTGAKWPYVWTRDLSYATHLGLAMLDPQRARNSLLFKVSGYRDGMAAPTGTGNDGEARQIVQDTGTGGSWPASTDRVTWALGASAVLATLPSDTERAEFAAVALEALSNTLENDRLAAYDSVDGLYRGEQSFLDWRDQTYAGWIVKDIAALASSKSLSTNVVHYLALTEAAQLANAAGDSLRGDRYSGWATALKSAIKSRFWQADTGLYSSMTAGAYDDAALYKYDWLGESLVILSGIASESEAASIVAHYPHGPMGAPVIFPQQPDMAIYHNRAVWPFVTAYGIKAAAQVNNAEVFDAGFASLMQGAALNLSNMENLEWITGKPNLVDFDHPELAGPAINSQRQLWSVGGYIGAVVNSLFGMQPNEQGIHVAPYVTAAMHRQWFASANSVTLQDLHLRGKRIDVTLNLPAKAADSGAYQVTALTLNGVEHDTDLLWSELGDSNTLVVTLDNAQTVASGIHRLSDLQPTATSDAAVFAPREPVIDAVTLTDGHLQVALQDGRNDQTVSYNLYRDGKLVASDVALGNWTDPAAVTAGACYAAEAVYPTSGNRSHHSQPVCYQAGEQDIPVSDARVSSNLAITPASDTQDAPFLDNWGAPQDSLQFQDLVVTQAGRFALALKYHNAANSINLGMTNGVKWMRITDGAGQLVDAGIVQMPHARSVDGKRPWVYSTPLEVTLQPGSYQVELSDFLNMSYLAHNATFGGNGGSSGAMNSADIAGLRILPLAP